MIDRSILIEDLREAARKERSLCFLLERIQSSIGYSEFNSFSAMSYLMDAFGLSLSQVRELPGAVRLGGNVYSDEEIEEMIYPYIKSAVNSRKPDGQ